VSDPLKGKSQVFEGGRGIFAWGWIWVVRPTVQFCGGISPASGPSGLTNCVNFCVFLDSISSVRGRPPCASGDIGDVGKHCTLLNEEPTFRTDHRGGRSVPYLPLKFAFSSSLYLRPLGEPEAMPKFFCRYSPQV